MSTQLRPGQLSTPLSASGGLPSVSFFEQLNALLGVARDRCVIPLDPDGVIANWEDCAERLTGHSRSVMVGTSMQSLFGAEDQLFEVPRRLLDEARRTGRASTTHLRTDANDVPTLAETTLVAVADIGEPPHGFVLITRNIAPPAPPPLVATDESAQVRESLRQLETITRCIPDVVALFDRDARFLYVNEAITRMSGGPPGLFIGLSPREVIARHSSNARAAAHHPYAKLVDNWEAALRLTVQSGESQELPFNFPINGDTHAFVTRMIPQVRGEGERRHVEQVVTITQDITARYRMEMELRHAKDAAEAASNAKDQFLAMLSHELRTPLTPVLVAAQEMAEDASHDAELRETAEMIRRNVELEARLIDDLLDVTRIAHGKFELQSANVNVHEVASRVVEMISAAPPHPAAATGHGPQIELELEASHAYVWGDPARLQQILCNLLKNAIKFSPADSRVRLRTSNVRRDGVEQIQVDIVDSGIGIAPDVLPVIFNAFEQGGAVVTRRFGGLGLGLAIARSLADLHGGTLSATSAGAGRGATFTLTIPTHAPPPETVPTTATTAAARGGPHTHTARILLVEDHEDSVKCMARMLRHRHFDVRIARNVGEAVRAAAAEQIDCVVSDVGLPDGTGHDLMRQLRGMGVSRGIALSGYGMEDDVAKSHAAGFQKHLVKPVNFDRLVAAIEDALASQ